MRIGLFTDTYRPSINGIVYVVDSLKCELEALGHEVYVFCPAKSIRPSKHAELLCEDDHVIRFPSFKSGLFDDFDMSVFFPPRVISQIRELDLDIVHIFTPSQVGLIGVRAAYKSDIPFVIQHCTDLYEFSANYPNVLPGVLALASIVLPTTVKLDGKDIRELIKLYRPRRGVVRWNQDIIERAITIMYSKADAVIALSRKSVNQLKSWQHDKEYAYDLTLLPNGVDALPQPSTEAVAAFRRQHGIAESDEVYGFVGRLGEEKNLPILIQALPYVLARRPRARLLFVGDFEYRKTLERMADESGYGDRVTFTGAIPREQLGVAYQTFDVFTFPSLKDTQGWVLHEAAHAGLPIVIIDREVSEVVHDGENGYYVDNQPEDLAMKVADLLGDDALRAKFGAESQRLAATFTERHQVEKLAELYAQAIERHVARDDNSW